VAASLAVNMVSASEVGKLLPPDTDVVLTLNVRQLVNDHKNNETVRAYLDQWRDLVKKDGLGLDPTQDIDRITCAFKGGDARSLVVLVEGRFQKDRLRAAVRQFTKENAWSFQVTEVDGFELRQNADAAEGINLLLLDANTLAITTGKQAMDDLLARAEGRKKGGLPAGLQTLLEKGRKEHAALLVNPAGLLLDEAARILQDEVGKQWKSKSSLAKLAVGQVASGIKKYAKDISTAGVRLSLGEDELKLRLDLETTSPKVAAEMRKLINEGNFWTALALKAVPDDLAGQLASIVLNQRVLASGGMLTIQVRVPYPFIGRVLDEAGLDPLLFRLGLPDDPQDAKAGTPSSAGLSHWLVEALTRQVTSIPIWKPPQPRPPGALEIEEVRDVAYRTGPAADFFRHRLDLFVPKGKKDYPVVVLVHGGGWTLGDNRCCGLYTSVGQFLASQGIGAVLPNYRLSPRVKHPEHVKDVAGAVAWARAHVAEYGGDSGRIYLLGHSAGGHLVSLLATDESYLKAEGLKTADLKGVISVSGVYRIAPGKVEVVLGGSGPRAAGPDQMFPLRGTGSFSLNSRLPAFPAAVDIYGPAFSADARERLRASPLTHVRAGLPPFLILVAEKDWPTLSGMADEFHQALLREGDDARLLKVAGRSHNSVLFSAVSPADPAARAILEFINKR
jgi:acetyl esterase/lipase